MTVAASIWRVVSAALRPRAGRGLVVAAWLPLAPGAVAVENRAEFGALALLEAHCVKCHGGEKTKGGLDLITREALLRGGETGVAVVPGQPEKSLLVQSIRHEKDPHMPHKEPKLTDAAITRIAEWVKSGAPYDRPLDKSIGAKPPSGFTITEADRKHWAFQPIQRPAPPKTQNPESRIQNPIDQFILAKIEATGLQPAPPADPRTLIRRLTLDLIGLPPTPEEVETFVRDCGSAIGHRQSAIAKLIDRLLASPHYGERWGRHWLDLARFAETDGFEHDATRPHSWRYRDYVIKAFNDDKPYDQFIREQLAGDELFAHAKPETQNPELLTATGFNLLGPDMVDSSDQVQRRHNTLNDMTDTASLAFLGLTMGCARCHDHKFEPLSQRDYYSLQAFFTPAKFDREKPIPTPDVRAAYDAAIAKFNAHPQVRELAALEAPMREKIFRRKVDKLAPEAQIAHRTPPEKRDAEQANLVLETADKVIVSDKELAAALSGETKTRRDELLAAVKKLPKPAALPKAMALTSADGPPAKTFVLHRGEYSMPGEEVPAGFPAVLYGERDRPGRSGRRPADRSESSQSLPGRVLDEQRSVPSETPALPNRAALADWIASPDNPLTARVMVNRIWKHHFGRGLVATPSEFGTHGARPTHPELLDWLAGEFIARGWSVKAMHRLMLTSATYQQAGTVAAVYDRQVSGSGAHRAPLQVDPDNRLLSRMNRLRLEGEVIRDSLLAISGQLNPQMGGPGVFPPVPKELFAGAKGGWPQNDRVSEYSHRSIYIFARRNLRFPFLEVFDAPDSNLSCPSRERSTTAPQSLTLLNADEVTTAARLTAARLEKECPTADERVGLAYRLALGRPPTAKELDLARAFLKQSPLNEFCRALFNLNEFVYVE